jgi:archaemetzincin
LEVLAHETGHVFSLHHCRTHECLMNGSNSLDETDRSPLHLGPHCLKKLQYNLRFDIPSRYHRLRSFYAKHGLEQARTWVERRLEQR